MTDEELGEAIASCLDENYNEEYGGSYHYRSRGGGDFAVEGETLLLGSDSFYGFPISITKLREKLGIPAPKLSAK